MASTMLAARLDEGAERFRLEEIAVPAIAVDDCLVRVHATGICGSDLHILEGITNPPYRPIVLGHETAGTVVDVGATVEGFAPGDRVVINPVLTCGNCVACRRGQAQICANRRILGIHREGAFAEYVAVPARNLVPIPDGLSLLHAAVIEPAATPFHALTARAPVTPGDAVAIFGAGGLGVHAIQIARMLGATTVVVVDIQAVPLERALKLGATHVVDASTTDPVAAIRDISGGGVDVALEVVGLGATIAQTIRCLRPGGIAAIAGIGDQEPPLPPATVFAREELDVRGVYCYSQVEMAAVARLFAAGVLDPGVAISATYPLEAINDGLEHFQTRRGHPVRVVIRPTGDDQQGATSPKT